MHQREIDGFMKALAPVMGAFVRDAVGVLMQPMMEANKLLADEVAALKSAQEALPIGMDEASVLRLVDERVAKFPPVEPGKEVAALVDKAAAAIDAIGPQIEAAVAHHVSALPKVESVKSVTVDDLRPMLQEMVDALPPAEPGKSVTIEDVEPLLREMVAALPPAAPGKSVTVDELAPLVAVEVAKAVAAIEVPGPDMAMLALMLGEKVEAAVAALPPAAPGKSVTVDELAPLVAETVGKAVAAIEKPKDGVGLAGAVIDREGHLVVTLSDGKAVTLGAVVGKDVDMDAVAEMIRAEVSKIPHPKNGLDGVGFDDLDVVEVDGDLFLRFVRGDVVKEFYLPVTTDRGVWTERAYRKGAAVSWGGQTFIAQRDALASEKPMVSPPGDPWRMSVKKGRDGDSAFDVARKAGFRGTPAEWLDSLRPGPAKPVKVG